LLDKTWRKGCYNSENEEQDCEPNFPAGFRAFDNDSAMEDAPGGEAAEDDPNDDLGQALCDAREDCESENERMKFQQMLEDHRKLLYPGCKDGLKKLGSTLELLQWKAKHDVSNKGFGELLKHIENILPRDNELPTTTYEAKQLVCSRIGGTKHTCMSQ